MKMKLRTSLGMLFMALILVLVGCGQGTNNSQGTLSSIEGTSLANSGTLFLKVNPEIAIDYDSNGNVTGVRGVNDDGVQIVDTYPDFIGKESGQVLKDLIAMIGEAGYFVEEVEGKPKQIVLELEAGSALPNNDFLEHMAVNAQRAVEDYKLNSNVTVDGETYISLEEAKNIAFKHAGVDGSQAKFDDQELETDDGVPYYELEFEVNRNEYEYDIHAVTGEVLEFEADIHTNQQAAQPKPAVSSQKENKGYKNASYGKDVAPVQPAKPAAPAPAPVAKPAASVNRHNHDTDYDDTDYDDSDYDDSDYDDSDYDDSDYDDSDYDDSDYN